MTSALDWLRFALSGLCVLLIASALFVPCLQDRTGKARCCLLLEYLNKMLQNLDNTRLKFLLKALFSSAAHLGTAVLVWTRVFVLLFLLSFLGSGHEQG